MKTAWINIISPFRGERECIKSPQNVFAIPIQYKKYE
jgi:hypothetical protein